MKVFISWSGKRSKSLAIALRDWLPLVLQYAHPWVSDKDISAGDRWAQAIAGELEAANFGIICITPENLNSEWILFEAGALSKSMLDAKVIPLLFGLELSDLSGPLSQFQALKVDQAGIMEVVRAINKVSDHKTSEDIVAQLVPKLWPTLEDELGKIPDTDISEKHMRPQHEILEELVSGVRGLNSRMRDFDPELSDKDRYRRPRRSRFHPRMLDEFLFMSHEMDDLPAVLLILGGLLREDYPWLAELLIESYREIKTAGPEEFERVIHKLRRTIKHLNHSSVMRQYFGNSKEMMMIGEELPMMLEMVLHHGLERSLSRASADADTSEG